MKFALGILILFSTFGPACAQNSILKNVLSDANVEVEYQKECGSPVAESQTFDRRSGRVVEIRGAAAIVFEESPDDKNSPPEKYVVRPAGIDVGKNEAEIRSFLVKNVLGRNVVIIGNTAKNEDREFFGIIETQDIKFPDVNRFLFEKGMAVFSEPAYFYSVSRYTLCVYRQLEARAKADKLGIWAK
ncbi:MAG: thermonuclease family protein [Acidobacteria bacterium]|nr:thermonuclease family protein [Acidobacteriota bacterium]